MSSALHAGKGVIIIASISAAIICASALYEYYRKKRSSVRRRRQLSPNVRSSSKDRVKETEEVKNQAIEQQGTKGDASVESSSFAKESEMTTTAALFSSGDSGRGGRRDYRHRRNRGETPVQVDGCGLDHEGAGDPVAPNASTKSAFQALPPHQGLPSCVSKHCQTGNILNDPAIIEASAPVTNGSQQTSLPDWILDDAQRRQRASDAELRGAQLAAEFSAKCQMTSNAAYFSKEEPTRVNGEADTNGVHATSYQNGVVHDAPSPLSLIKGQCVESPSLSSDMHSEGSQDSGKGTSLGLTSSMSPVEELIEIPAVYEFEVPQDIVGLLIGKQGTTIKWLTQQSQAHIVIRQHIYSDRHKICTLEGTREQINICLRLIRRKFPPSRFPDLKLTPVIPPPVTTSHTPVWDNVIQLHVPEGVNCEVVVSSIVNAGHFFVQQPTHPTFPSLTRLDQYMVAVYSQPIGVPPLPRPVDIGVICAAPVLGGWYRAQTIEVYEDTDEVLVKFVDYGGYSRIHASDLRQIRSDFMTLPFQSTECYLAHVKPTNDGVWSQEASSVFEQLAQGKVLEAAVVGHANDNIPLVELYSPAQDSKSMLINRLLAESGHAEWTD